MYSDQLHLNKKLAFMASKLAKLWYKFKIMLFHSDVLTNHATLIPTYIQEFTVGTMNNGIIR